MATVQVVKSAHESQVCLHIFLMFCVIFDDYVSVSLE